MKPLCIVNNREFPDYIFNHKLDDVYIFDTSLLNESIEIFFENIAIFLKEIGESKFHIENTASFEYLSSSPTIQETIVVEKFIKSYDLNNHIEIKNIKNELILPDGLDYFSVANSCLIKGDCSNWGVYFSMSNDLILILLKKELVNDFNEICMLNGGFNDYFIEESFLDNLFINPIYLKRYLENYLDVKSI